MTMPILHAIIISFFFTGLGVIGFQVMMPNSIFNRWQWKKLVEEHNRLIKCKSI